MTILNIYQTFLMCQNFLRIDLSYPWHNPQNEKYYYLHFCHNGTKRIKGKLKFQVIELVRRRAIYEGRSSGSSQYSPSISQKQENVIFSHSKPYTMCVRQNGQSQHLFLKKKYIYLSNSVEKYKTVLILFFQAKILLYFGYS